MNGCELLVHTFMVSLFAPKLIAHCGDNKCDLQGLNVDQHTVSTLLDFIYKGQVQVERQRLDSIRRGANLMGLEVLSQLISQETKQDSINTLPDNATLTETNKQIIASINSDKPANIRKNAILRCSRCDYKVKSIEDFEDHLANVHQLSFDQGVLELSYKCRDCDFEGEDREAVAIHRRECHPKKKVETHKCSKCDFVSDDKLTMIRHLKTKHKTVKSLKCMDCNFHTTSKKALRVHQTTKHKLEYECEVCDRKLTTFSGLNLHFRRSHLKPEDQYPCDWCNFKTKEKEGLKRHLERRHDIRGRRISRPKVYTGRKKCTHCGEIQNNKTFLIDHLADTHKVDLDGNPAEPKYKCRLCDFVACAHAEMDRHYHQKHLMKKKFECDECGNKFLSERLLSDHITWKHYWQKPYMCELCGNFFASRNNLLSHRPYHSHPPEVPAPKREFACELCEKSFGRKCDLNQHMTYTHEDCEFRFGCQQCSFWAISNWKLIEHFKANHREYTLRAVEEEEGLDGVLASLEVEN